MELQKFIDAVSGMRNHQKLYFKVRKQSDLIEAKKFEKVVDKGLAEGIEIPEATLEERPDAAEPGTQIGLFEQE